MLKKIIFTIIFVLSAFGFVGAQNVQNNADTVLVLPFENKSEGKPEFNWIGEAFAESLSYLLAGTWQQPVINGKPNIKNNLFGFNVISNDERKIKQQQQNIPLTVIPSLATSLRFAKKIEASKLIFGNFKIYPTKIEGKETAVIVVETRIIDVAQGSFDFEKNDKGEAILNNGKKEFRKIDISGAVTDLQSFEGEIAYQILLKQRVLTTSRDKVLLAANKVPSRAFEAYIKGLLASESDLQTRENYLRNAMRIYKEDENTKGAIYAEAALELGHLFLNQRKLQEAIDYFSQIPTESQFYPEAAFYTGLIHWQQQNYEQALAVLRPLAEDLKLTSVYNTIGAIAVQASRAEKKNKGKSAALLNEGIELLKKALDSAPDESNVRFNYSFALFLNLQYTESAQELRPVLANSPKDGESYFLLAKSLELLKDTSAADFDNQARRFLVENDRYAKLQNEWSRARTTDAIGLRVVQPPRKDFVGVILLKNQTRTTQSPVNETDKMLGEARQYYKDGRDDDAMSVLRRVLVSEPMSAESYYLLGMIHLRRGDKDQAVSSFRTALFYDNQWIDAYIPLVKIFIEKNDCLQAKNYLTSGLEVLSQLEKDPDFSSQIDEKKQEVEGLQRMVERCSTK